MAKTVIVNIYNFIRMSHVEPSRFIPDDFETIRNQIILVKQYGFPATYALKYDALMEPRYQRLLREYLDEEDEVSAWWEITRELCQRAGVLFRGRGTEEHDDRVDSAYSIGYEPEERKRLVDAYMADFHRVFGRYPGTIGSWVLDSVTLAYAAERYGVLGGAICRDQLGTDGFTLWGGYPNGIYYPSRKNEFIPAQTPEEQLPVPMFRLLGPDPIYNFEQDARPGLQGVYTLEPSWLIGRDPKWISWFFHCLTEEDRLGVGYAHVGQENNFLWENIRPGFAPQLDRVKVLRAQGKVRVETMANSAAWFRRKYSLTPPMTFQASRDWDRQRQLSAQWYAGSCYRVGFLGEQGHLRIRDFFLYRQDYPSRYWDRAMTGGKSTFDALPVLFPQAWMQGYGVRPFIRLLDAAGREPMGVVRYSAPDELTGRAELLEEGTGEPLAVFTMEPTGLRLQGGFALSFDCLPVFVTRQENRIMLEHAGFRYDFLVCRGIVQKAGRDGLQITPEGGEICLALGEAVGEREIFSSAYLREPAAVDKVFGQKLQPKLAVPPFGPVLEPAESVFAWGQPAEVRITSREPGEIRYTLDGAEPTKASALYREPLTLEADTMLSARLFLPDGRCSETVNAYYRFGLKDIQISSTTVLDARPVFCGNGVSDLLEPARGTLDYLDGRWRGTLQDWDLTGSLPSPVRVGRISLGFLSHHRSGIVYPESVQLFTGPDVGHLRLRETIELPCRPCSREIEKQDITFQVHETVGCFRLVAHRYEKMPQWCCYRGVRNVFTMADNLIVEPEA